MTTNINYLETPTAALDEQEVIAAVLNGADPESLHLTPHHFDSTQPRTAWEAILNIANTGGKVNPTSLRAALGDAASVWILEMFSKPVIVADAEFVAHRVRRAAHLRDLQALAVRINEACLSGVQDPTSVVEMIRAEIEKPVGTIHGTETFADALPALIHELQHGRSAGLPTPWPELDKKIHGLSPGELYIVAARPGVGKSLMGQNLAVHWSRQHAATTFFASIEMGAMELTRRALAQTSKVNLSNLLEPETLADRDWQRIDSAGAILLDDRIHMCTDPSQTLESIRANAREVKRRHGLGLVVVDYLQIVNPRDRSLIREQQVAEVSRGLKLLSKELQVPVVAMAQIRRIQGEKPTLNDLRESGSIEQDADAVLMLHIPDEATPWEAELLVAKARSGTRGPVELEMRTHWAKITSAGAPVVREVG